MNNRNSWELCGLIAQQLKRQLLTPQEERQKRERLELLRAQLSSLLGATGTDALRKAEEITDEVRDLEAELN
jgi:hypothetical protein